MLSIPTALAFLVTAFMPDKRSEVKPATAPESYTLPHLGLWLASHDPAAEYDFNDGTCCVFAQYAQRIEEGYWCEAIESFVKTYGIERWPEIRRIAVQHPWTFGAALERARALEATWQKQ